MTKTKYNATMKDVLTAIVTGGEITADIKERAQAELDAIARKNEKATAKRAEKKAEKDEAGVAALDAVEKFLADKDGAVALADIAKAVGVTSQFIQGRLADDARFERVEVKGQTPSGKTSKKVGYKLA